jgi:hypothetical protein
MNDASGTIREVLQGLKGEPAWGLTRTHGSMFFLELGRPHPRPGEKKVHGQWHFLFQMCHWRFEDTESLVVGSDDSSEVIDEKFARLQLDSIHTIETVSPSNDLRIAFGSGVCIRTFCTSSSTDESTQWELFDPNDNVWISDATGRLVAKSAHA